MTNDRTSLTLANLDVCARCPSRKVVGQRAVCGYDDKYLLDHAVSGGCAEGKLKAPASDQPGRLFAETITCLSGDNCELCRKPEAGREWRREQKAKFVVPNGVLDFPCPHGKPWDNAAGSGAMQDGRGHYVIVGNQGAGDGICLTAAIRDLHLAYPGRFRTAYRGQRPELLANNPYVVPEASVAGKVVRVGVYPGQYRRYAHAHMSAAFHVELGKALGVEIPVLDVAGDVHLSDDERDAPPEIEGPYWLLFAGGKHDYTTKWWPRGYYQELIDRLDGQVKFVRVGAGGWQPSLRGVVDVLHKTPLRRLIRLMYHAQGGVGPVSFGMHLAAAVPTIDGTRRPYVVLAGGGETPSFYLYPGHTAMQTIGKLACCAEGGCWRFKAQPVPRPSEGFDRSRMTWIAAPIWDRRHCGWIGGDCVDRVWHAGDAGGDLSCLPRCMTMVRPADVADAILAAIAAPRLVRPKLEPALPPPPPADPRTPLFHALWREIHAFDPSGSADPRAWLCTVLARLPCGECSRHALDYTATHPPDFSSRDAWYAYSVTWHNAVNVRLGKPQMSITEARLAQRAA
jgi:hypothetical protein